MSCAGRQLNPEQAAAFRAGLRFERLADRHAEMLAKFQCHPRIDEYLRTRALDDARQKRSVSWVFVHEGSVLVAYVSLATCSIEMGLPERQTHALPDPGTTWPGMLIGQLGTDKGYRRRHVAQTLIEFAIGQAATLANDAGCRLLVADINVEDPAMAMYQKLGFEPCTAEKYKSQAGRGTPRYFFDLFTDPPIRLGEGSGR
jgi:ribosomal protein S18 acetylase RimI-like enzyme